MEEFGTTSDTAKAAGEAGTTDGNNGDTADPKGAGGKLILEEERETGAVSWHVYYSYAQSMGSMWWAVLFGSMLALTQVAQVFNSLFLGFWTGSQIPGYTNGDYMAIYAALGVAMGVFTFGAMFTMILAGIRASLNLFDGAWRHVMRSPTGWHDRTPTGRIISRLSKDIEMLDDRLSFVWNQLLQNALDVVGTFSLVVYTFPYLGLIFVPLVILYYLAATYYRKTSREIKRVDSISRSAIYSSFGEQLSGLPVIRAFGQQDNFERKLQVAVNVECQAYIITIAIQRWLGVRLDLMSNTLVLLVAIFGAIFRNTVSPSKLGVVLTYTLASASVFSQLVQLFAQVEQEMNNVERVQYYNELQVEAAPSLPNDPQDNWPSKGEVVFKDVEMRYRHDLPLVLKGLNFRIQPGEKVGIIGRTGAGKSSIAQALFRTVELSGGSIEVDGLVLADLGLDTVRNNLAIIPQDAFLFGGTVRENIDPAGTKTDAELNDALNLIHNQSAASHSLRDKFRLDGMVQNEGANFSAGERQLLALVRALARGCKLLLLDEATSSVDPETDQLVQRIVQTEFQDVTVSMIELQALPFD
jgi:ATP-binding cassette subfamily C (CFTR/MRP) protein 1